MWQTALQQLKLQDIDLLSFNASISACDKGQEWPWAVQQLLQLELLGQNEQLKQQAVHTIPFFPIMLTAFFSDLKLVCWIPTQLSVSSRMSSLQMDSISRSAVLSSFCHSWRWPSALHLLTDAELLDALLGSCELAEAPGRFVVFSEKTKDRGIIQGNCGAMFESH